MQLDTKTNKRTLKYTLILRYGTLHWVVHANLVMNLRWCLIFSDVLCQTKREVFWVKCLVPLLLACCLYCLDCIFLFLSQACVNIALITGRCGYSPWNNIQQNLSFFWCAKCHISMQDSFGQPLVGVMQRIYYHTSGKLHNTTCMVGTQAIWLDLL